MTPYGKLVAPGKAGEMGQIFSGLFRRQADSTEQESASELNQTRHRLALLTIISTYVAVVHLSLTPEFRLSPAGQAILTYYFFYTPAAISLHFWVRLRPGHYPIRRLLAMVLDSGSLAYTILIEPLTMMPLYMVIIWITLGNGLRFGATYQLIATGIALISVFLTFILAPWTEATPYFALLVVLSIIAIPGYAQWLLQRIAAARAEAEAASLAKSRMLAQASHDLRQPIHAMSLLLVSLEQSGLDPAQRDTVDRLDRSLQGVARLFRSLLDLSTLDSGSVQPQYEAVAMGDLLEELVLQNLQQAEWNGTDLRMVDSSAVVLTDRNLLATMIQNLLSNALKFSGGRAVLVGCRNRGGAISVEVWDQGIGIAPADQRRVFEEFVQVRERGARDQQGAGLGLSIVRRMASLLGLQVTLRSRPGQGSCFAIVGLPRTKPIANQEPVQPRQVADWTPLGGLRVLLVEDDEDVLVATMHLLRSWQCHVETDFGLPRLPQDCDVIVTDFDLGSGTTGADVIAAVRKAAGRKIPAIVLTGHDGELIAREINDPGIPVLHKPVRPAELRSALMALRA